MVLKIQYTDQLDKQNKIDANQDRILIEEQNLFNGNFLIFSDVLPLDVQVNKLKDDNLILMDALATTFEEVLMLQEQVALLGGTV